MIYAIVIAAILSIIHFFSKIFSKALERTHIETLSFSAGIFITFIFLDMFPEIIKGSEHLKENIFLLMLMGFIIFHLSEKYVYQHVKDRKLLQRDIKELHIVGFFIEHFVIGFALVLAFQLPDTTFKGLIAIPFIFVTLSSSISLEHLSRMSNKSFNKIILCLSTLIGALVATFLNLTPILYYGIFSFIIGALLYIVVRDLIPKREKGKPLYFIIGVIISIIILIITRRIVLF